MERVIPLKLTHRRYVEKLRKARRHSLHIDNDADPSIAIAQGVHVKDIEGEETSTEDNKVEKTEPQLTDEEEESILAQTLDVES